MTGAAFSCALFLSLIALFLPAPVPARAANRETFHMLVSAHTMIIGSEMGAAGAFAQRIRNVGAACRNLRSSCRIAIIGEANFVRKEPFK